MVDHFNVITLITVRSMSALMFMEIGMCRALEYWHINTLLLNQVWRRMLVEFERVNTLSRLTHISGLNQDKKKNVTFSKTIKFY